ncbi:hypothetical protein [Roseomonas mucosa]
MSTTQIDLCALPARRVREAGYSGLEIHFTISTKKPQRRCVVAGVAGVARAVAEFGREVQAVNPEASFKVLITMVRGQRKPRGFDKAEQAGVFGELAFLRDGVSDEALRREMVDPPSAPPAAA